MVSLLYARKGCESLTPQDRGSSAEGARRIARRNVKAAARNRVCCKKSGHLYMHLSTNVHLHLSPIWTPDLGRGQIWLLAQQGLLTFLDGYMNSKVYSLFAWRQIRSWKGATTRVQCIALFDDDAAIEMPFCLNAGYTYAYAAYDAAAGMRTHCAVYAYIHICGCSGYSTPQGHKDFCNGSTLQLLTGVKSLACAHASTLQVAFACAHDQIPST